MTSDRDRVFHIMCYMRDLRDRLYKKVAESRCHDETAFYQNTATRVATVTDMLQGIVNNLEYRED